MRRNLLALLALSLLCGAAAPDPKANSQWPNGLPTRPDYFPIGVWVQDVRHAERYRDLGVNLYVALWRGPTQEQLDALEKAGMSAICAQNERALNLKDSKVIVGWMHGDEPDNAQPLGRGRSGYGPPVLPEKVVADYERMRAADPTRPVLLNLGQGVAWDNWVGRGVRRRHPEDYPHYLKGCDVASFDIYPACHDNPEVAGKLEFVGRGVGRLVEWTEGKKRVWCCIETTHIHNEARMATPAEVRSEVWLAITHGATGLIYFCHEFKPKQIEAGLLAYPEMAAGVKAINAEIAKLAPVLNGPTVREGVEVASSDKEVPVSTLCKRHDGATYLFAVSERGTPTEATFTLPGLKGASKVEVLGENRTIDAKDGRFTDRFDGYAFHHYRVAP
jgi:hypothetical protein